MMAVVPGNYHPGDPLLIDQIVCELKSQGIFDTFRKECIADVDTKPAYQNLRQRVEGSVTGFLRNQIWRPDMNKNQVREMLRKNIYESGFLETGVERIVDQVVNPKMNTVFLPKVTEVVYKYLGVRHPNDIPENTEPIVDTSSYNLLPKDLDAVSPESGTFDKKDEKLDDTNSLTDSKVDEDESPPFEPIEEHDTYLHHEENSIDSHLSGFSGLMSHESNQSDPPLQIDMSQDSQMSKHSSDGHLSVVLSDDNNKIELSQESTSKTTLENEIKKPEQKKEEKLDKSIDKKDDKDKYKDKYKSDRHRSRNDGKSDKRSDKKDSKYSSKDKSKDDKEKSKDDRSKDKKDSKSRSDYKSSSKSSSNRHSSSSSSRDKSSSKKDSSSSRDYKDKSRDKSSSKDSKSRDDKARDDSKSRDDKSKSSSKNDSKHRKDDRSKTTSSSSRRDKDKKDTKKRENKDDHYSSKHRPERRSTDRDSNDGSGIKSSSSSYCESNSSSQNSTAQNKQEGAGSTSTSNDSGNSEAVEHRNPITLSNEEFENYGEINLYNHMQPLKLIKPKFASNIHEARRLMKIRKQLKKIEKQSTLALDVLATADRNIERHIQHDKFKPNILKKTAKLNQCLKIAIPEIREPSPEPITPPLRIAVSAASWDALEAKLNQNINYDTYYDLPEDNTPTKEEKIIINRNEHRILQQPVFSDTKDILSNIVENNIVQPMSSTAEDFMFFTEDSFDECINIKKINADCITKLETEINDWSSKIELSIFNNIPGAGGLNVDKEEIIEKKVVERKIGIKRKLSDGIDIKNIKNNNNLLVRATGDEERFSLPLSPSESDNSIDKRTDSEIIIESKPKRQNIYKAQRYSSEDLYKPRPFFKGTTARRRAAKFD